MRASRLHGLSNRFDSVRCALFTCMLPPMLAALCAGTMACANDLVVQLPRGAEIKSAIATASGLKLVIKGQVTGQSISFPHVLADTPYDVQIALADGMVLQGVDVSWYDLEPSAKDAGALTTDDRAQINAIVRDLKDFYNKKEILALHGDHDRAVGLAQLVRDKDFFAGKGQVIWRIELWYFKNEAGGWAIVGQQNKILRRERFKDAAAYHAALATQRWIPALGGLKVGKGEAAKTVALTNEQLAPSRKPE